MILIGEKINAAIPAVREAVLARDAGVIRDRAVRQAAAGADYIDCAAAAPGLPEYETFLWLLDVIQEAVDTPVCLDSPDASLLKQLVLEGVLRRPGMLNSVNEESDKCETLFPLIAGSDWQIIGLCCDAQGIPSNPADKLAIAMSIVDKADRYGVAREKLHIDPCVMALATIPSAMQDFEECIRQIHQCAPGVKVTGALSNVSYEMPARRYVNLGCVAYAVKAGLDSAILDPCNPDIISTVYACEALCGRDKGGRKYNRAYRQGKIGAKKGGNS